MASGDESPTLLAMSFVAKEPKEVTGKRPGGYKTFLLSVRAMRIHLQKFPGNQRVITGNSVYDL